MFALNCAAATATAAATYNTRAGQPPNFLVKGSALSSTPCSLTISQFFDDQNDLRTGYKMSAGSLGECPVSGQRKSTPQCSVNGSANENVYLKYRQSMR